MPNTFQLRYSKGSFQQTENFGLRSAALERAEALLADPLVRDISIYDKGGAQLLSEYGIRESLKIQREGIDATAVKVAPK